MTTTEPSDDVLDAVNQAVTDDPAPPSHIARRARVSYGDASDALKWLTVQRFIVPVGNGSWTKYRQRRAGEVIR